MEKSVFRKALSIIVSLVVVFALSIPATALAAQPEVQVDNHVAANGKVVSEIAIDGVDALEVGKALDDEANVSTAEGETWEIPVLWIGDDLNLSTSAVEGRSYLPALAFFVPQGLSVEGGSFTVTLSESLTKLFGSNDVISVFDPNTGITYILPASLRDFFRPASTNAPVAAEPVASTEPESEPEIDLSDVGGAAGDDDVNWVAVFCSQTAQDAISNDDLSYIIDLVRHTLEPQAVELLRNSFPAFKTAASKGQIGKEIGFYVYYKSGDKDGHPEHESAQSALAYVSADVTDKVGELKYCYLLAVDVDDLVKKEDGNPVADEETGKYTLLREGPHMATFNNTIVHEIFHAYMDDYNRTGMLGSNTIKDGYTPGGQFTSEAQKELFNALHYPQWFIEGTASAVENVYAFRYSDFKMLRAVPGSDSKFEDSYTANTILNNYLNAKADGKYMYYELGFASDTNVNTTTSRYVSGYLATLYLSQLAAQKDPKIGTAVDAGVFSSSKLRLGLNSILERMHNGETLDAVIKDISTIGDADPLYESAADFQSKFICGPENSEKRYNGDNASLAFTTDFLNYMLSLENQSGRDFLPNGSILFAFDQDYNLPLDPEKKSTSNILAIADSNEFTESTVSDAVAFAGGGKSDPPKTKAAASTAADEAAVDEAELPLAAKEPAEDAADAVVDTGAEGDAESAPAPDPASAQVQASAPESE